MTHFSGVNISADATISAVIAHSLTLPSPEVGPSTQNTGALPIELIRQWEDFSSLVVEGTGFDTRLHSQKGNELRVAGYLSLRAALSTRCRALRARHRFLGEDGRHEAVWTCREVPFCELVECRSVGRSPVGNATASLAPECARRPASFRSALREMRCRAAQPAGMRPSTQLGLLRYPERRPC